MQNQTLILFLAIIAALAIALALFHKKRTPLTNRTITRDAVVQGMDDGWMVVDNENMIVDLNRATEEMIGLPREKIHGQPINTILTDWANIFKTPETIK